jgi:Phosphate-induced protein 1 conserved region
MGHFPVQSRKAVFGRYVTSEEIMNIQRCRAALVACGSILAITGMLCAQDVSGNVPQSADGIHARGQSEGPGEPEIIPHRTNPHLAGAPTAGSTSLIKPTIGYHGGSVIGTPNVYLIWYGNWSQSNGSDTSGGKTIVRDFLYGLNNSNYYMTNASYPGVSGMFAVKGEYTDSYSHGVQLSDSSVQAVVTGAISGGHLPKDTKGIYFVLTSSDVAESSGFCSQYCGWHTYGTISGSNIKYSFVGNSNRCLNACAAQTVGPNGNAGVDGMVSVIAHELEEANTDPNLNAWYNSRGYEDADMCAWTFGSKQTRLTSGAYYNITLPTATGSFRNFLIQRELDVNSKCYIDYPNKIQ